MGRTMDKPLREGKVVKVIEDGNFRAIFRDDYITYDQEEIDRIIQRVGEIIFEGLPKRDPDLTEDNPD